MLPIIVFVGSIATGLYPIDPWSVCQIIFDGITGQHSFPDTMAANMVWQVRLPRACAAALAGIGLSLAGAVFQGIFKNPLASPYTLGVSNGAGFGAGIAILFALGAIGTQVLSVGFGLIAVGITFAIAARRKSSTVTLVLAGMLVGSLFASLVALLKFVADPTEKLPQIVYWLMGSLSSITYDELAMILPLYIISLIVLFLFRWRTNVLSLGDREARSFGIDVRRDRAIVISAASVLTALVVSISGIIGWVGIVVPHLARMIVGPDYRKLLPAAASLGACYLMVIDDLCRTLTASEIPIGVITGIIGVPMFLYFIYKGKINW
jgi:iron complex transport system permease protein